MTQITAEEGAYVKAGDVLIELDTQSIDIDIDNINNQVEVLKAQKKIYDMISAGKDVSDISVTHYSSSLQPYITAITETDKAYHNNLSILESAKENAGLTRDIANIKLEEFKAKPYGSVRFSYFSKTVGAFIMRCCTGKVWHFFFRH